MILMLVCTSRIPACPCLHASQDLSIFLLQRLGEVEGGLDHFAVLYDVLGVGRTRREEDVAAEAKPVAASAPAAACQADAASSLAVTVRGGISCSRRLILGYVLDPLSRGTKHRVFHLLLLTHLLDDFSEEPLGHLPASLVASSELLIVLPSPALWPDPTVALIIVIDLRIVWDWLEREGHLRTKA